MFPAHSKFTSPATKVFVLSDKNRAVCATLTLGFLSLATDFECLHTCNFLLTNGLSDSKHQPKVCPLWLSFSSKMARVHLKQKNISSFDLIKLRSSYTNQL